MSQHAGRAPWPGPDPVRRPAGQAVAELRWSLPWGGMAALGLAA
ncbi:hypothetical protein [Streptomyces sp. NPDC059906]